MATSKKASKRAAKAGGKGSGDYRENLNSNGRPQGQVRNHCCQLEKEFKREGVPDADPA